MDATWIACLALAALGLAQGALMLVFACEHRRYHRARRRAALRSAARPAVTLFVPCKGLDLNMRANVRALFEQRYDRLELCFLLEGAADPAARVVESVRQDYPLVRCRTVTTGPARDCGQKVHNLMCGAGTVAPETDVLAFVDSDACPHPDWLARLVDRLHSGKFAIATGYRWYVPSAPFFVNRLLAAVNHSVVAVMGPHGFNLVWGGAWAIRAADFQALGLPEAWAGSLSDDLVVSRLAHQQRLKVAYEPHCLVSSTAEFTWSSLAEFLRRQYTVVKVYAPRWWWFGLAASAVTQLSLWGLAALALVGGREFGGCASVGAAALAACYLLGVVRFALAAGAVRPFVSAADAEYLAVTRLGTWGWPLVSLTVALGLAASAFGRTITWRGIRYRLDSPSRTTIEPATKSRNGQASAPSRRSRSAA